MWCQKKQGPVLEFIFWTFLIVGISYTISIIGEQSGVLTNFLGNSIIKVIDTFVAAMSPVYATYIVLKRHGDISSIGEFIKRIFHTQNVKNTMIITITFCFALLITTMLAGERTNMPWYTIIPALPLMILSGGLEEIGWRGFLQPELEKRMSYILTVIVVTIIWFIWHVPLWFINSSNQSSYDFLPYLLQLTVNAFALSAIYKVSKSTIACVIFHAFGNAVGALYEWKMFASFPISNILLIYYCFVIIISIIIHIHITYKKNKK